MTDKDKMLILAGTIGMVFLFIIGQCLKKPEPPATSTPSVVAAPTKKEERKGWYEMTGKDYRVLTEDAKRSLVYEMLMSTTASKAGTNKDIIGTEVELIKAALDLDTNNGKSDKVYITDLMKSYAEAMAKSRNQ
jgi:hypothetical protein